MRDVRWNVAGAIVPMPVSFGQMSALISFSCESWRDSASAGTLSCRIRTHSAG